MSRRGLPAGSWIGVVDWRYKKGTRSNLQFRLTAQCPHSTQVSASNLFGSRNP
jgi:hypothetical protein